VGLLQIDAIHHANFSGTVLDVIVDGRWNFPDCLLPRMNYLLVSVVMPVSPLPDTLVWPHSPDGKLSAKQAMLFLKPVAPLLPWADMIWRSCIPPFHSFIFWRLYLGKMPTDENLRAWGCVVVFVCSFCLKTDESSVHLFLHCPFAVELWIWICGRLNCTFDLSSVIICFRAFMFLVPLRYLILLWMSLSIPYILFGYHEILYSSIWMWYLSMPLKSDYMLLCQ